jgi:hypothetical protein
MFENILWKHVPDWWLVHPDHITIKVEEWEETFGRFLAVHRARQFTGETLYALTITDPDIPADRKKKAAFLNVHTMEYGACAGIMNFAHSLLTGRDLQTNPASFPAEELRKKFIITLIPDSNPQGKLRLPFSITDGSQFDNSDNDTVHKVYYGIAGGKPFRRCPVWKMSEEHVEQAGTIYEKISTDDYVIPDMDLRSTVMRMLDGLGYAYPYDMVGHLHQAEFAGCEENCYCATSAEPWISLPMRELQDEWATVVIDHWRTIGGRPIRKIDHHKWAANSWVTDPATGFVRKMGTDFTTLRFNCPSLIMETQMHDPKTSPLAQMRLASAGIEASLQFLSKR